MTVYETLLLRKRSWYDDPVAVSVWVHLLMKAKAASTCEITVPLSLLAVECGVTKLQAQRKISDLSQIGMITVSGDKDGTIITICALSEAEKMKQANASSADDDTAQAVERLYALYPTKTPCGDSGVRSTGKCAKDKRRLAILLKTYTAGQIETAITNYVTEQDGKWLKNFSTFLNNLPECGDERISAPEQTTGQDW